MKKLKHLFSELNRLQIIGLSLALIIISGFAIAAYANSSGIGGICTAIGCPCQNFEGFSSDRVEIQGNTTEIDCNTCTTHNYIFHIGVLQIVKDCEETQVNVCEAGEKVDEYYRDEGCSYEVNTVMSW